MTLEQLNHFKLPLKTLKIAFQRPYRYCLVNNKSCLLSKNDICRGEVPLWSTKIPIINAAPIRGPVRERTGFSKSRGLRASVSFFPLPHPLPSTFLLSPYFSRVPNTRCPNFVRFVRERLLRRLNLLRYLRYL